MTQSLHHATRYVVTGRFRATDSSPSDPNPNPVVEVGARDLDEARMLALWYRRADDPNRDGEIRKVGR